jgi:hypothetical protein
VITSHSGGDGELEVLGLLDVLAGEVSRVEGGRDQDIRVDDVLGKVRSLLVRRDNELDVVLLAVVGQTEGVLNLPYAEQMILSSVFVRWMRVYRRAASRSARGERTRSGRTILATHGSEQALFLLSVLAADI